MGYSRQLGVLTVLLLMIAVPVSGLSSNLAQSIIASMPEIEELEISTVGELVVVKGSTGDPEAAAEIERRLRAMGHERIVNGIAIVRQRSDASISSAVERELYLAGLLVDAAVTIRTTGGIVVLSGSIAKQPQIETALRIAGRVEGVREVRSELTSDRSTPEPRP